MLHVLDWCQWGRKHGGRGGKCHNMFFCQRHPCGSTIHVPYPIHCTQIQTVLHWEGFKDSTISADSGHERVGMMGGGGGGGLKSHVPIKVLVYI